jgi:hypothetical protein
MPLAVPDLPIRARPAAARFHVCAVAGFLLLASCNDGPTGNGRPISAPVSVAGCYALELGKWSAARRAPDPPANIALLDSLGSVFLENGKTLVRPNPLTAPFSYMAWWSRLGDEHLTLNFTDGFIGVRIQLVWGWGDDSWRGTAVAFSDVGIEDDAYTTVQLRPRSCT